MKRNKSLKLTAVEWLDRRKNLKEQIETIKQKLQDEFPGEAAIRKCAGDAWDRYDALLRSSTDLNGKIRSDRKGPLEALRAEYDHEREKTNAAIDQRRALNVKLNSLENEFAGLKYFLSAENFTIEGLGKLVRESVKPLIDMIKAKNEKIDSLKKKRGGLEAELEAFECPDSSLDEDALLNSTVEDRVLENENIKQLQAKKEAARNLLQQTESAIEDNKKQLDPIKEEFAEALTSVLGDYTQTGMVKTAKKLKSILDEDDKFSKAVFEVCRDLLSETGTSMIPIEAHIVADKEIRDGVLKMVNETLK